MFEYKLVEIPLERGFKVKIGDIFEKFKNTINEEAKNGERLKKIAKVSWERGL